MQGQRLIAFLQACESVKATFEAHGRSIGEWADLRGYKRSIVYAVLNGRAFGHRGTAHKIAIDLGLKAAPRAPMNDDLRRFFEEAHTPRELPAASKPLSLEPPEKSGTKGR